MTFDIIIGDIIDNFRKTIPAVNQEFAQKSQIETTVCQSCVSMLGHVVAQCLGSLHSKQLENGRAPAKKRRF